MSSFVTMFKRLINYPYLLPETHDSPRAHGNRTRINTHAKPNEAGAVQDGRSICSAKHLEVAGPGGMRTHSQDNGREWAQNNVIVRCVGNTSVYPPFFKGELTLMRSQRVGSTELTKDGRNSHEPLVESIVSASSVRPSHMPPSLSLRYVLQPVSMSRTLSH